jgi:hypothetical protein
MDSALNGLITKHIKYGNPQVIIFPNCGVAFFTYLTTTGILVDFSTEDNHVIARQYNDAFIDILDFYSTIQLDFISTVINSYIYMYTDYIYAIEEFIIMYKNNFIQLSIFNYDDLYTHMTVNGKPVEITFMVELDNPRITYCSVYNHIINYVENFLLENAFKSITI